MAPENLASNTAADKPVRPECPPGFVLLDPDSDTHWSVTADTYPLATTPAPEKNTPDFPDELLDAYAAVNDGWPIYGIDMRSGWVIRSCKYGQITGELTEEQTQKADAILAQIRAGAIVT